MKSVHLGKESEKIACEYLKKNKFKILNQNWRSGRFGEIDLIVEDINTKEIVFVEVKSRKSSISDAKELVTQEKQTKLYKLAKSYLYLNKKHDLPCRFDVIAIKINDKEIELEHIKNAF
ncbi:MAG: YraN family protein [Candidatus Melainabacteria bacterium]|nr:YraN family protein [Candidatus Melainabacteria bacterium]